MEGRICEWMHENPLEQGQHIGYRLHPVSYLLLLSVASFFHHRVPFSFVRFLLFFKALRVKYLLATFVAASFVLHVELEVLRWNTSCLVCSFFLIWRAIVEKIHG